MQDFAKSLSLTYAAGSLGALANAIVVWALGAASINAALGIKIAPAFTLPFLYSKLVWGGLWGFLFLLPFFSTSPVIRGLVYSIGPTLVQLFLVFPLKLHNGMMGLDLGTLTPVLVIVANAVWGIVASLWLAWTMPPAAGDSAPSRILQKLTRSR